MTRDQISEYPYSGKIYSITEYGDSDVEELIYEGEMDEHMDSSVEGNKLQTSSYVISIPLTKNDNDEWIVPQKGDKVVVYVYGNTLTLEVENAEPSQLGGVSIYAKRKSW